METYELSAAEQATVTGFSVGYLICVLVIVVLLIVANWKIFTKAGEAGWKSIIPLWNDYILFKIGWGNGWLFLLTLIPIVNIVVVIMFLWKFSKSFGHGAGMFIALLFVPNIATLVLAFGSSQYIGPNGAPAQA